MSRHKQLISGYYLQFSINFFALGYIIHLQSTVDNAPL